MREINQREAEENRIPEFNEIKYCMECLSEDIDIVENINGDYLKCYECGLEFDEDGKI